MMLLVLLAINCGEATHHKAKPSSQGEAVIIHEVNIICQRQASFLHVKSYDIIYTFSLYRKVAFAIIEHYNGRSWNSVVI